MGVQHPVPLSRFVNGPCRGYAAPALMRLRILATALVLALACAAVAQGRAYPKPPLGAWKLTGTGAGFTLKSGSGKSSGQVVLANLHFRSPENEFCAATGPVKVLGTYALKQFHRGGYTAWGVGRNAGGEPTYTAAKVVAGGKTVDGSFYLLWDYENPAKIFSGGVKLDGCSVEFTGGGPK